MQIYHFSESALFAYSLFLVTAALSATETRNSQLRSEDRAENELGSYPTKERIIGGGEVVSKKSFPWMVAVVNNYRSLVGGGVILSEEYILTAAHVLIELTVPTVRVLIGCFDMGKGDWSAVEKARNIILHPQYNRPNQGSNDIGLIHLKVKLQYSTSVQQACLPVVPEYTKISGEKLTIIGWGRTTSGDTEGKYSKVLLQVEKPVLDARYCKKVHGPSFDTSQMICCGVLEGGLDSCDGDSGGPAMLPGKSDNWIVVGLVSWGYSCAQPGSPSVYTRVSNFIPWILDYVNLDQLSQGCN